MTRACMLCLAVALVCVAGCAPPTQLPPEAAEQFADVPAPDGFVLSKYSYSTKAATVRSGTLRYSGDTNLADTEAFYRDVMPKLGWELYKEETSAQDDCWLYYRKMDTVCVVLLRRDLRKTYIVIELR